MKRNFVILFIAFFIFLFSCNVTKNKEAKRCEFYLIEKIKIPLDSTKSGIPDISLFDYDTIDDVITLILVINKDRLAFYDISKQIEYHSVPLLKNRKLNNFDYINKDSILLYYEKDYYINGSTTSDDNILQITDYYGNTKICDYLFTDDKVDKSEILPFSINYSERFTSVDNKYFFLTHSYDLNSLRQTEEQNQKFPVFCYYDLNSSEVKVSKSLGFPYTGNQIFYNSMFQKIHSCISANGLPLIRFFYSTDVFEWDYKNDVVKKYQIKSQIFDTVYPISTVTSAPESLMAMYSGISYDPYNKKYYSDLFITDFYTAEINLITVICDKNFNYLGETAGLGLSSMPIFTKDYIIDYWFENDSIVLYYKGLRYTDKALKPYIDSVKMELNKNRIKREKLFDDFKKEYKNELISILDYYKVRKNESDYALLSVYERNGYHPSQKSIKNFISQNNDIFADLPFFLILSGNQIDVKRYESIENIKLVQDTLAIVEHLGFIEGKNKMLRPRLTIVKDNKIVLDTIFDSYDTESDLLPKLPDNLGFKEKNN